MHDDTRATHGLRSTAWLPGDGLTSTHQATRITANGGIRCNGPTPVLLAFGAMMAASIAFMALTSPGGASVGAVISAASALLLVLVLAAIEGRPWTGGPTVDTERDSPSWIIWGIGAVLAILALIFLIRYPRAALWLFWTVLASNRWGAARVVVVARAPALTAGSWPASGPGTASPRYDIPAATGAEFVMTHPTYADLVVCHSYLFDPPLHLR